MDRMRKVCRAIQGAYLLVSLIYIGYYSVHFSWYNWGLAAGSLLLFPAMALCRRLIGGNIGHATEAVVYGFTLLAYGLGECAHLYYRIPGYDKIMHMMSGAVTVVLAWSAFYRIPPGRRPEASDAPMAILFCMLAAMAVAGMWEIGEYILSQLTGMDVQKVAAQGIHDTMKDMMVCMAGALACLPSMLRFYRGRRTLLGCVAQEAGKM